MSAVPATGRPALHAARFIAEAQRDRYPDWQLDQWLVYAKRLCKLTPNGRVVFDYDMRIAEPFKLPGGETGFDLWGAYRGLAEIPSLVVRGRCPTCSATPPWPG